ncbi:nuclear transport factor 2 family protein [Joostella sp. CR20]|uniref:nuclear transport factor 2 family protein n=1 Tax=Joostella sp. CR20 TaxID=2804312 RepID=UPI00313BB446
MKHFCLLFLFIGMHINVTYAQTSEEANAKQTIINFFEAFHRQDSIAIKKTVSSEVIMQTIGKDKQGVEVVKTANFSNFLKSIVGIPSEEKFEEKLLDFSVQVDGSMAHAWTPYEFWYNGTLSHCGVNSFQLFKEKGVWKIIYIIDTRRKDNCQ